MSPLNHSAETLYTSRKIHMLVPLLGSTMLILVLFTSSSRFPLSPHTLLHYLLPSVPLCNYSSPCNYTSQRQYLCLLPLLLSTLKS